MYFHVLKTGQRRDVRTNVATFPRVFKIILANVAMFPIVDFRTQHRDVGIQHCDVPESLKLCFGKNYSKYRKLPC